MNKQVIKIKAGERLFVEGERHNLLYYLKSGAIKLTKSSVLTRSREPIKNYLKALIAPGNFLNVASYLKNAHFTFSAETMLASEIWGFEKQDVQNDWLFDQLTLDLKKLETTAQFNHLSSVEERIVFTLLSLASDFGTRTNHGVLIDLNLNRNALAVLAGTINESISRHIKYLTDAGFIRPEGRAILIFDIEKLKAVFTETSRVLFEQRQLLPSAAKMLSVYSSEVPAPTKTGVLEGGNELPRQSYWSP
jgi:CRP/FNR family transcriptional regulator